MHGPLVVALAGEPAVGKSHVLRLFLAAFEKPWISFKQGVLKGYKLQGRELYVLGVYDGSYFGGTDRLAFNVAPQARRFFTEGVRPEGAIVFEGDRLCCGSILQAAPKLQLWHVCVQEAVLAERRALRTPAGRGQDARWLKGRRTKVRRLAERFGARRVPNNTPEDARRAVERLRRNVLDHLTATV